jgi:hypothetical protein
MVVAYAVFDEGTVTVQYILRQEDKDYPFLFLYCIPSGTPLQQCIQRLKVYSNRIFIDLIVWI